MKRVYNFSAGPAALPLEVLEQARAELTDYQGTGMSVMEMSHRSDAFAAIATEAESDLRTLLSVPDDYHVLFLQGGATLQFSMAPLNLMGRSKSANYVNTGYWSAKAIREAGQVCSVHVCADGAPFGYHAIPPAETWNIDPAAGYLHYTPNETIGGVEFHHVPDVGSMPLVADLSSTILSRRIDVGRFALLYAGAQKNIGPSGLAVVIVRKDMLYGIPEGYPHFMDYKVHAAARSMFHTPATFAWYMAGLVFKWILQQGGVDAMAVRNERKAAILYKTIDNSGFYHNPVHKLCRSWMNITFTLADPSLDSIFLQAAAEAGLVNLKGHRSVGGMRASIYNAMPEEGVRALVDFMTDFEKRHA